MRFSFPLNRTGLFSRSTLPLCSPSPSTRLQFGRASRRPSHSAVRVSFPQGSLWGPAVWPTPPLSCSLAAISRSGFLLIAPAALLHAAATVNVASFFYPPRDLFSSFPSSALLITSFLFSIFLSLSLSAGCDSRLGLSVDIIPTDAFIPTADVYRPYQVSRPFRFWISLFLAGSWGFPGRRRKRALL